MQDVLVWSIVITAVGLVSSGMSRLLIWKGPRDRGAQDHKVHTGINPTSGGIAVFVTVVPTTLVAAFLTSAQDLLPLGIILAASTYMFVMGLWDDLVSLRAIPKLFGQILISIIVCAYAVRLEYLDLGRHLFALGPFLGIAGSAAWLVVTTNALNFMDGSDGLAMGSAATISAGLVGLSLITGQYDLAIYAGILLAGLLGLLVFNGRGKLFSGDAGSLFVGFYLACLILLFIARTNLSVWVGPALFIGILADVLLTLIWRFKHNRSLLKPHREHIYQLILSGGMSHALTAWIYVWIAVHGALIAGMSLVFPRGATMAGFFLLLGILYVLARRIRRAAIDNEILIP